jgi:hypothetical protein
MSILFCALTANDGYGASATDNTTAARYDATWNPSNINIPDDNYWGFAIPAQTDVWIAFNLNYYDPSLNTAADGEFVDVFTDTGGRVYKLDALDGAQRAYTANDGVTWLVGVDIRWFDALNNLSRFDIHLKYNAAASGLIEADTYINGIMRKSTSGTLTATDSGIAGVRFSAFDLENGSAISGIIVADEDTRGMVVSGMTPDGAGNYTAWSGTHASMLGASKGGGIESNVNGDRESWTLSAFPGASAAVGMRVVHQVWAYPGATGVSQVDGFLRISATDYDSGALTPTPGIPLVYEWNTNPATAAIWDTTALGLLEAGVEAVT